MCVQLFFIASRQCSDYEQAGSIFQEGLHRLSVFKGDTVNQTDVQVGQSEKIACAAALKLILTETLVPEIAVVAGMDISHSQSGIYQPVAAQNKTVTRSDSRQ